MKTIFKSIKKRIMESPIELLKKVLSDKWNTIVSNSLKWWIKNQRQIYMFALMVSLFQCKDVSFSIQMNAPIAASQPVVLKEPVAEEPSKGFWEWVLKNLEAVSPIKKTSTESLYDLTTITEKDDSPENFSVLNFLDVSKPKLSPEELKIRNRRIAYAQKYKEIALTEMRKFGIPASITLAQGIVETNAGLSGLATKNNNHFGMKCFSKKCKKGHCSNFSDDHHKDFFRIYKSSWESYRSHSLLLANTKRYRFLFDLKKTDYKGWAFGLKKAGYATDKHYAQKLIEVIEDLELCRLDQSDN